MKTIHHRYLGGSNTPQDIKDLRQSSFDFHESLGYPVLFKHRWTLKDFQDGLVEQCPLHDDLYNTDPTWDNICFGTGFIGGYRDAEIVYISFSDAPTDTIKITPQGLLQFDHHPQITAPWIPYMEDDDLLIMATFDPDTWEVEDLGDRYLLKTVTQATIRGPGYVQKRGRNAIGKPFVVHQETTADKLPYGHPLYEVPLIFDYNSVDPDVTPPDYDPNEPLPPIIGTYAAVSRGLHIRGKEIVFGSAVDREIWVDVVGENVETSVDIRLKGEGEGVEFHW